MDITPHVGLLDALRHQRLSWKDALGELVDNSLDAGASRVEITIGPGKRLCVSDDGSGCKDVAAMVTLGGREHHSTTRLGRYGIGLKDASLWLWGETSIDTVHRGQRRSLSVDWSKVHATWSIPDPTDEPAGKSVGTTITFSRFDKRLPNPDEIAEELGYLFAPAILASRQVLIIKGPKRKLCEPYRLPPLTDVVESAFEIDGRGVRLRAGIVAEGHPNPRRGFTRQHAHRTIDTTSLGAGGHSVARIAGIVEFDGAWALTKNKDDITEYQDELGIEIFARCKHIIQKADLQSQQLESEALDAAVSSLLNATIRAHAGNKAHEARSSTKESSGTVSPKETGRTRRTASKTRGKEGPLERAARTGLTLDWSDSLRDLIGEADLPGSRVTLNASMDTLAGFRREGNTAALAMAAFSVFSFAVCASSDPQKYLPNMERVDFMEAWSGLVSNMPQQAEKKPRVAVA